MTIGTNVWSQTIGSAKSSSLTYRKAMLWFWIIFGIAVAVKTCINPISHTNYPVFEAASLNWWTSVNAYDTEALGGYCYRYGLAFTVAMLPLAAMPTWLGGTLWTWLNMVTLFFASRSFARKVLPVRWDETTEALYLALVLVWSSRMVWAAQSNPLVIACVLWGAIAIKDRRWWLAAGLMAVSIHIKVWPIAAAMLMVACWPKSLSWRMVVAVVGVGLLPFLAQSPTVVIERYQQWLEAMFGPMQIRHDYRDAWTMWEIISPPVNAKAYAVMQLAAAGLTLMACYWQKIRRQSVENQLTMLIGMWLVFQLVFGPGTERNTFGIVAPIAAWALIAAWQERSGRVLMASVALLTLAVSRGQTERALVDQFPVIMAAHPVGILVLAVWLIQDSRHWERRTKPAAVPTEPEQAEAITAKAA